MFTLNNKNDYMTNISKNCELKMQISKPLKKISEEDAYIPSINDFNDIIKINFNVNQLKKIAKNYKLKISGNKKELVTRLFVYLYLSSHIIKIQKLVRNYICKTFNLLHGPAFIKKKLCTNNTDFITMEPINEININQFISYKDNDGFIYGFDLVSLYNLCKKLKKKEIQNPYNRNMIPEYIFKNIKRIIKLSPLFNCIININIEDDLTNISDEKLIELRALTLFQNINSLGNYSEPSWFLSLNRNQLIKLMRELIDIWNYRAQLSLEIKRNICPPNGDPFSNFNINFIISELNNINNIRKAILEVLEKLINSSSNSDNKSLGAYYILGSLTLVNNNAASSLPWLYQSFTYF